MVLGAEGQEKFYVSSDGNTVSNLGLSQHPGNLFLGKENIVSESGEPLDSDMGLYVHYGGGGEIFSVSNPEKRFDFMSVYVETDTYAILASLGYDVNGFPIVYWKPTSDWQTMGAFRHCIDGAAQLAAKLNPSTVEIHLADSLEEGGAV